MPLKADWLLQILGEQPIDPIRIQKGMFLFSEESGANAKQLYKFVPYNWGPCSFEIYRDLDELLDRRLVERVPVAGTRWHKYRRTARGTASAVAIARSADATCVEKIGDIRETVMSQSFRQLLESVYKKYSKYASKSLFRD